MGLMSIHTLHGFKCSYTPYMGFNVHTHLTWVLMFIHLTWVLMFIHTLHGFSEQLQVAHPLLSIIKPKRHILEQGGSQLTTENITYIYVLIIYLISQFNESCILLIAITKSFLESYCKSFAS